MGTALFFIIPTGFILTVGALITDFYNYWGF